MRLSVKRSTEVYGKEGAEIYTFTFNKSDASFEYVTLTVERKEKGVPKRIITSDEIALDDVPDDVRGEAATMLSNAATGVNL